MNQADRMKEIRRILIALDASPASQAALELAAELAARHQAELIGIYVEDINLLRSAEIPITSEVGVYSAISRQVDSRHMQSELKAHARRVEQLLSAIAQKTNLRWSFRSVRGLIHRELINAAEETDLIILGKRGWSEGVQIGSTARTLAALAPVHSLILEHKIRPQAPVLVVYDGSPDCYKALRTASRICPPGGRLIILAPAADQAAADELYSGLVPWIEEQEFQVEFRRIVDPSGGRIANLALVLDCDIVVLSAESPHFQPEAISQMLEKAHCAVLLVR